MADVKAKLKALLENPFDGYNLTDGQRYAATWAAFGYSQVEIAGLMFESKQSVYLYLVGARKKIGIRGNRDFTKKLMTQLKLILET